MTNTTALLKKSYAIILLLSEKNTETRIRLQSLLCDLRDEIAIRTDDTSENVQNIFESLVTSTKKCKSLDNILVN